MSDIQFSLKLNMYGHPVETPFQEHLAVAEAAERLGFFGAYTIDHFVLPQWQWTAFSDYGDPERPYFPEAWTSMAAWAARTSRLRIGPQVTPITLRHPVFIAKMAATLDLISQGRLILQVGTGWNKEEYEAFGFEWNEEFSIRYAKMCEGVEIIKQLWTTDGPVTYQGKYYQLEAAPFWPKPVQKPHPPIWFGGTGKKVQAAVAKYGDAWTPAAPHYVGLDPHLYAEAWTNIQNLARAEGRDPSQILPAALFFCVIAPTREAAYQEATKLLRRPDWAGLSLEDVQRKGVAIIGSPDDVIEGIQRYVDVGVRHFTLGFVPISSAEVTIGRMQLFADKVMPHFQRVEVS